MIMMIMIIIIIAIIIPPKLSRSFGCSSGALSLPLSTKSQEP